MVTMRALGARTGHVEQAEKVARGLQAAIDAVRTRVAGKPRPRTLLVFGREPGSLRNIYASAGRGFLHDMLVVAGGEDVLTDIDKESAQVSTEMILARKPDVILELNAANAAQRSRPQGRRRSVDDAVVRARGPEQARDHPQRSRPHRAGPAGDRGHREDGQGAASMTDPISDCDQLRGRCRMKSPNPKSK